MGAPGCPPLPPAPPGSYLRPRQGLAPGSALPLPGGALMINPLRHGGGAAGGQGWPPAGPRVPGRVPASPGAGGFGGPGAEPPGSSCARGRRRLSSAASVPAAPCARLPARWRRPAPAPEPPPAPLPAWGIPSAPCPCPVAQPQGGLGANRSEGSGAADCAAGHHRRLVFILYVYVFIFCSHRACSPANKLGEGRA